MPEYSEYKPYKPYKPRQDGEEREERRPYQGRNGQSEERRPYQGRNGQSEERRPYQGRNGQSEERRPYQGRDNREGRNGQSEGRRPYQGRDNREGRGEEREERDQDIEDKKSFKRYYKQCDPKDIVYLTDIEDYIVEYDINKIADYLNMIPSTSNSERICEKLDITDVGFRKRCSEYAIKWKDLLANCDDDKYKKILKGIKMPVKATDVDVKIRRALFLAKWTLYSYYSYSNTSINAARYFGLYCGIIQYFNQLDSINDSSTYSDAISKFTADEIRPFVRTNP
jgi:hypothetical protein